MIDRGGGADVFMDSLDGIELHKKDGSEPISYDGISIGHTIFDFWKWAYSDIISNVTRGVLAEYIVALALGIGEENVRMIWEPYDLITPGGLKVEVKSAAYLQSWKQRRLSSISFACNKTQIDTSLEQDGTFLRRADVYVFALLKQKDKSMLNPLDLSQWQFWVVPAETLNVKIGDGKRINTGTLQRLGIAPVAFPDLKEAIIEVT